MRLFITMLLMICSVQAIADKPVGMFLATTPWRLTADGNWQSVAKIQYVDQNKNVLPLYTYRNGFIIIGANSRNLADWVEGGRAAIISTTKGVPVKVNAWSLMPSFGAIRKILPAPNNDLQHLQVTATNIGPYANSIAWTPLSKNLPVKSYQLVRFHDGESEQIAVLPAGTNRFFDHDDIDPQGKYQYQVTVTLANNETQQAKSAVIETAKALPKVNLKSFYGKGIFLSFSPKINAPDSYKNLNTDDLIQKARRARFDFIELQLQYSEFQRINNPDMAAWFNALLNKAHRNNIKVIAWVTPCYANTETEKNIVDLIGDVTPSGDSLDGVAMDIEPGASYMGDARTFPSQAVKLLYELKMAVGNYPITAIVPTPTILSSYPYARIAPYIDLVAPMIFWHHRYTYKRFSYDRNFVSSFCQKHMQTIQQRMGRKLPMMMVAQSADLGNTGVPSASETRWALQTARSNGAVGVAFFNWHGMRDEVWNLLSDFSFT